MGLVIAGGAFFHLSLEPFTLVNGVVDFAEGVADFAAEDVALEAAGETGAVGILFCEGRGFDRVADDEGGLNEMGFDEDFE